jgi:hypothetical protein
MSDDYKWPGDNKTQIERAMSTDYEMIFSPGGLVPVNVETTGWLVREVLKLRALLRQTRNYVDKDHYGMVAEIDAALSSRKSLGWINVMRDTDGSILVDERLSPSREHADLCARLALSANPPDTHRRKILACVEIFEGDGI